MSTTNPDSTLTALTAELAQATPPEGVTHIGILAVKTANRTIIDAATRPNPRDLYLSLWYEGEVCCLFADSNIGKSIFAVQMAEEIARTAKVLYLDCELSDKQFQLRYCDKTTGARHIFPENLLRAEIRPEAIDPKTYEESIIRDIETAALNFGANIIIVDNLTYLCNSSEKGDVAGLFMMKLLDLKKRHNMSILIIAHTPKRNMANPITQNDLAGSKKLYNFFDSVIAIGQSAKDQSIKYVKQVKVRAGEYRYGSDNVISCEIVSDGGYVHFAMNGFAAERDHLRQPEDGEVKQEEINIVELHRAGKSVREIASELGLSKSKVGRILQKAQQVLSTAEESTENQEED